MARELQSDIFGDLKPAIDPAPRLPWQTEPPVPTFMTEQDWRSMLTTVDQLRKKVSELESVQSQMQTRQNELVHATKVRIERIMGSCQRMDEVVKGFISDTSDKLQLMTVRLGERKLADHKVQDLVDRHASMLQTYEVRLQSLQKILNEQEMQLMNARSFLQEAARKR